MITKNLNDKDILEFLLTSEINEEYKPEEYKFLLMKFRSYYKILLSRKNHQIDDLELNLKNYKISIDAKNLEISKLKVSNSNLKNEIELNKKKRKLTWKERINGEIEKF